MSDPPVSVKPNRLSLGAPGTQLPTRSRLADDFLDYLDPSTVVDALSSPNGGLRSCLASASITEREFAMRTAMASQSIWEWLDELLNWNWPAEGGPEGFQSPSQAQRKLFVKVFSREDPNQHHIGCLPAGNVTRYEKRIEQINRELDQLDLEDIKSHIMTQHIMPLSRPTTPAFDPNQSFVSSLIASCTKLDDVSALVTAIVMQTLPNLARLSHLLQTWGTRVSVLQQVNPLLHAISDAESSLQENWVALSKFPQNITSRITKRAARHDFTLTRADFEARKHALAEKVAQAAQTLDFMLDCLEGSNDTLPDEWLTRLEEVEQGYGEWVAAYERWLNETEWTKSREVSRSPSIDRTANETTRRAASVPTISLGSETIVVPLPLRPAAFARLQRNPKAVDGESSDSTETDDSLFERPAALIRSGTDSLNVSPRQSPAITNSDTTASNTSARSSRFRPLYRLDDDFDKPLNKERKGGPSLRSPFGEYGGAPDDAMTTVHEESEEEDEGDDEDEEEDYQELPPLRSDARRNSSVSQTSTIMDHFGDFASDLSFPARRKGDPWRQLFSDDCSPRSSPPPPEAGRRRQLTLLDSPLITSIPEDGAQPALKDPFFDVEEDPTALSDTGELLSRHDRDEYKKFQEKIGQAIIKCSGRVKLASDVRSETLNPPDFQHPRLKKRTSTEPMRQSNSGHSMRTATPSFTLSPARGHRSHRQGNHEIRVYHLSRSNGDTPIKLFIRCVGERVMVRVGGGWADLGEYLKEYVSHHGRRSSGKDKVSVEVRKLHRHSTAGYTTGGSSPPSRPASVADDRSPMTPLNLRKTRMSVGEVPRSFRPKTPGSLSLAPQDTPPSDFSGRSRSSSHSWAENESFSLGLAGPMGKKVEMSEENRAWVESVKEKVRMTSGDMKPRTFGDLGKVHGTKRVFPKAK